VSQVVYRLFICILVYLYLRVYVGPRGSEVLISAAEWDIGCASCYVPK